MVAGFQGVDGNGNITTLGRGGSDTTGVALAAALKADECQIYTDVDGVYTTDPRVVPQARRLDTVSYTHLMSDSLQLILEDTDGTQLETSCTRFAVVWQGKDCLLYTSCHFFIDWTPLL